MALATYSKQANDETLENIARKIRDRAVKQLGRLLREIEPQKGGRPKETQVGGGPSLSPRKAAAEAAGISARALSR